MKKPLPNPNPLSGPYNVTCHLSPSVIACHLSAYRTQNILSSLLQNQDRNINCPLTVSELFVGDDIKLIQSVDLNSLVKNTGVGQKLLSPFAFSFANYPVNVAIRIMYGCI